MSQIGSTGFDSSKQMQQTDSLLNYISDLKKVATSNKNKRQPTNSNSSRGENPNKKNKKQLDSSALGLQVYTQQQQLPFKTPTSNNFFKNAGFGISSDEEAKRQLMSPSGAGSAMNNTQYLSSADESAQQIMFQTQNNFKSAKDGGSGKGKLASKCFKVINANRSASILKGYQDNARMLQNSSNLQLVDMSSGQMSMNQTKARQTPMANQEVSHNITRNQSGYGNLFKLNTPSKTQIRGAGQQFNKIQINTSNFNIAQQNQLTGANSNIILTPSSNMMGMSNQNLLLQQHIAGNATNTGSRKKFMEDIIRNVKKTTQKVGSFKKVERVEKNVIIRKNSSKSLLKDTRNLQTPKNMNQTQIIMNPSANQIMQATAQNQINQLMNPGTANVISNEFILIQNQTSNGNLNKTQIISNFNSDSKEEHKEFRQPTPSNNVIQQISDKKKIMQARSQSSHYQSNAQQKNIISKQNIKFLNNPNNLNIMGAGNHHHLNNSNENVIQTQSTDMTEFKQHNYKSGGGYANGVHQSNDGDSTGQKRFSNQHPQKRYGYTINNSLGKKSINMSQHYNDSSLYGGMNMSLGKEGTNALNLTSLLKSNLLEDDGIEDLHFYYVAFNKHKDNVLKKMEHKQMVEQMMKEKYDRGEIDCDDDIKRKSSRRESKKKTQRGERELSDIEKAKIKSSRGGGLKNKQVKQEKQESEGEEEENENNKTIQSEDEIDLF